MANIELSRQEIWTILCWAGDPGAEGMLQSYNTEEASIIRKLRLAMTEENTRLKAKTEAMRKASQPSQPTDHDNQST